VPTECGSAPINGDYSKNQYIIEFIAKITTKILAEYSDTLATSAAFFN